MTDEQNSLVRYPLDKMIRYVGSVLDTERGAEIMAYLRRHHPEAARDLDRRLDYYRAIYQGKDPGEMPV